MTEPLDELTVQAIGEYKGKKLTDLGKENVDLAGDEDEKNKKEEQAEETEGGYHESSKDLCASNEQGRGYSSTHPCRIHYTSSFLFLGDGSLTR